ncbi:MAG: phosphate acetyltransferase [Thermomicrobiales bacterium]
MARNIYITSAEGHTGKSSIALGLLTALKRTGKRIGLFRPVSRSRDEPDRVLEFLLSQMETPVPATACIGVTYEDVHTDPEAALAQIIDRYKEIEAQHEFMLILGSDYTDISTPTELGYNARIATNLGAPVLLVLGGRSQDDTVPLKHHALTGHGRTAVEMFQTAEVAANELRVEHARLAAVIANRVDPDSADEIAAAIRKAIEPSGETPVWTIPDDPVLVAPRLDEVMRALSGRQIKGDSALLGREVLGYVISGMSLENILTRLIEGAAVVVAGDRSEVLPAILMAHDSATFPTLSGIIVNGGLPISPAIERLIAGIGTDLPIISTEFNTFDTALRIMVTRGRLTPDSQRKIDVALSLFDQHVEVGRLIDLLNVERENVVTPLMFEYQLIERARRDPKHIVLPEGDDERILRAANTMLQRGAARLTLLGDEGEIRAQAAHLDLDIAEAAILSPRDPELVERFAQEYARLRAHKGVTIEAARETVTDVSYFGTMMVHLGLADGMVSGAAHTTAHTIRPAFEVIKTNPDVSIVSSVFLMALPDRVLVYGDCAVNPNPDAGQLADIAISSAHTARQFGIEPRVAMLSYSTGESGSGEAVDRVREATRLVQEREPSLLVDGPMQYDAAAEISVARSKLPDSPVAGNATVFIFPDLNTGNNTYKAVQRSAGAVAIGPVLQGLRKPINDLSRGALVKDIVNTIAITVIQAQGEA